MCRSIKKLRQPERAATSEEIGEAALQFVRKLSGYRSPATRNLEVFERAVKEISEASGRLLRDLR